MISSDVIFKNLFFLPLTSADISIYHNSVYHNSNIYWEKLKFVKYLY